MAKYEITDKIDRLIPVREAFAIIGWGVTKGYAEIAAGRLVVVKNGRNTFVRASETQRYISALPTMALKTEAA
ncbi:MAG: hypothetical protein HZY79_02155 [Rhodoblastus sp.]|nr:MAG: hypothetical protein HZY79_02155 [Rhodoblastus sp.]